MPVVNLELSDIIDYVGFRKRPWKEGESVFKAGHIFLCAYSNVNKGEIIALCIRSSQVTASPHQINIKLDESVKNWCCRCSCKAGESGYCKHVIATLIYINRCEELDELSCTDTVQAWGKVKGDLKKTYGTKISSELCHGMKKDDKHIKLSPSIERINFDLIVNSKPMSALGVFVNRWAEKEEMNAANRSRATSSELQTDLPKSQLQLQILENIENSQFLKEFGTIIPDNMQQCCKKIIEQLSTSNIFNVAYNTVQGSDQWLKERKLRLTGSRCYGIYTFPESSDEWERKAVSYFCPKGFKTKQTEYGKKEEINALTAYKSANNCEILVPALIICSKMPWLGYSPDGIIFKDSKPSRLLEIKCPWAGKICPSDELAIKCDFLEVQNGRICLKKTARGYYAQIQLGMALLNLETTDFIVYSSFSKTYLCVTIAFDRDFAKDLICTISKKYFQRMLHVACKYKFND